MVAQASRKRGQRVVRNLSTGVQCAPVRRMQISSNTRCEVVDVTHAPSPPQLSSGLHHTTVGAGSLLRSRQIQRSTVESSL
jgi:hypothetical protein